MAAAYNLQSTFDFKAITYKPLELGMKFVMVSGHTHIHKFCKKCFFHVNNYKHVEGAELEVSPYLTNVTSQNLY
jgi:hypothetical protein